jgi:cytochrome c553
MNLTEMSLTELTRLRRDVLAAIASKRPKPVKVKVRKVVSAEERERARLYEAFREEHQTCWACHRTAQNRPSDWLSPFFIERAHITKDGLSKRLEDVRLIAALCSRCHWRHTNGQISIHVLLRLKREHDPDNYDPEFLQKHSIRKLVFPTP